MRRPRVRSGDTRVTARPFAGTREVLRGYYLMPAGSHEEADGIVARHSNARGGAVEVRPLFDLVDPGLFRKQSDAAENGIGFRDTQSIKKTGARNRFIHVHFIALVTRHLFKLLQIKRNAGPGPERRLLPTYVIARRCDEALSVHHDALGAHVDIICGIVAAVYKAISVFHLRSPRGNVLCRGVTGYQSQR